MADVIRIETPLTKEKVRQLKVGDSVLICGIIYTGQDATCKKMVETLASGEELPFNVQDQIIYFAEPTPSKPGQVIGSAGPTSSRRMDAYSPALFAKGLTGMIGKGQCSSEAISAMKEYGAVYLGGVGGAGALMAKHIISSEVIAYPELGTEALCRLIVRDFPAIVIIDSQGHNLHEMGKAQYRRV